MSRARHPPQYVWEFDTWNRASRAERAIAELGFSCNGPFTNSSRERGDTIRLIIWGTAPSVARACREQGGRKVWPR